jgi:hypothetical protein
MNNYLLGLDSWMIALMVGVGMLAGWRIGYRIGNRYRHQNTKSAVSKFDDAVLALLSLLLAFTFGMSLSKHDKRREMVVVDSNAIGDFYTCATLVKEPVRSKLRAVIRHYAELRLLAASRPWNDVDDMLGHFQEMHAQMTDLVAQALADGTPIAVPLTNTLNGLTSSHGARVAAIRDRLPANIVMMLFVATISASILIGREQGLTGKDELLSTSSFILIVSVVIWVTLDLNQPERGFIKISQDPIQQLINSMDK